MEWVQESSDSQNVQSVTLFVLFPGFLDSSFFPVRLNNLIIPAEYLSNKCVEHCVFYPYFLGLASSTAREVKHSIVPLRYLLVYIIYNLCSAAIPSAAEACCTKQGCSVADQLSPFEAAKWNTDIMVGHIQAIRKPDVVSVRRIWSGFDIPA